MWYYFQLELSSFQTFVLTLTFWLISYRIIPRLLQIIHRLSSKHLVLDRVLPRVAIKSLIQFKSVSKRWKSHVRCPTFAKLQLELSPKVDNFLLLVEGLCYILSYDEHDLKELLPLKRISSWILPETHIISSCNGLICLLDGEDIVIWNPAISKSTTIDPPLSRAEGRRDPSIQFYGFGYSSINDDYKVIFIKNWVYSLKKGEWKKIISPAIEEECFSINTADKYHHCGCGGIYVNDVLYWGAKVKTSNSTCLVEYDLNNDEFKQVTRTNWIGIYKWVRPYVIKGCLGLYACGEHTCDVWIFNKSAWEHLSFIKPGEEIDVVNVSVTGKFLVRCGRKSLKLVDPSSSLPPYHPNNDELPVHKFDSFNPPPLATFGNQHYVESLVWPPFLEKTTCLV